VNVTALVGRCRSEYGETGWNGATWIDPGINPEA
jgi:hypothetical protein